jgi:hypothetical protein
MGNFQSVTINDDKGQYYTSVFWDLVDSFDQRLDFGFTYSAFPLDRVSGFTMPQLENALKNAEYWTEYRNNVMNQNPSNATVGLVPELFANWE